jgi:protein arginine kinase activator
MSCKQNIANVKLTKLVKGTVEELWLCQECAAQQSPYQKKSANLSLDAILAGILSQKNPEAGAKAASAVDLSCPTCGLPFESYRSTLLLGCSDCYESFEKQLVSDLRKFHGSIVHRGRAPEGGTEVIERRRSPEELRRRLQEAVETENFELAAKLRDEIRKIEDAQKAQTSSGTPS